MMFSQPIRTPLRDRQDSDFAENASADMDDLVQDAQSAGPRSAAPRQIHKASGHGSGGPKSGSKQLAAAYNLAAPVKVATAQMVKNQAGSDSSHDQMALLLAALSEEEAVASPDAVWELLSRTIKRLDLRNAEGKAWFVPAIGSADYRPTADGGLVIHLIRHQVHIASKGTFRIDEMRKTGRVTIFRQSNRAL